MTHIKQQISFGSVVGLGYNMNFYYIQKIFAVLCVSWALHTSITYQSILQINAIETNTFTQMWLPIQAKPTV